MLSRKRKQLGPSFYHDEDDEDDDIWLREASAASLSNKAIRQTPPNPYSTHIDILENQYTVLQKAERDLQLELETLEASLQALEHQQYEQKASIEQAERDYLTTVQETLASYEAQLKDTQNTDETINLQNDTPYLRTDALLIRQINRIHEDWKSFLNHDNLEDHNAVIKSTVNLYRRTEFDIIDLLAQIGGYEARIYSLDHDRSRLNSLPQIVSIVNLEIEQHTSEMKNKTQRLEQLETSVIRPYIEKVSAQNVFYPLYDSFIESELKLAQDYQDSIEFLYHVCIKQRAYQQFTTLMYERDANFKMYKVHCLKLLTTTQQPELEPSTGTKDIKCRWVDLIKNMLRNSLDQIGHNASALSLDEQIKMVQKHAAYLKDRWLEDIQSCQDAANELNQLHERLSSLVYSHSKSSEALIMVPTPYATMQEDLEFRVMELQNAFNMLEKEANDSDKKITFDQQRKLFSLFFTDPLTFEQLHSHI